MTSVALLATGCSFSARALRVSQTEYNQAIQQTINEQLLLNLVRLRYRDPALFMQITNVSTQFEATASTSVLGTINENVGADNITPDSLQISGGLSYAERPTISITPLQGEDFVTRMLKSYELDTIALLHTSGWDLDRILILTVSRMNSLGNAVHASNPTPDEAPIYKDFLRVTQLMRELQRNDALFMGYSFSEEDVSDPLPASSITAEAALATAQEGYSLRKQGDGYVMRKSVPVMQLTVAPEARDSPTWAEICKLLAIAQDARQYQVSTGLAPAMSKGNSDRSPAAITIESRSLLGTMFLLSHAVETPTEHRENGLVTTTRDDSGREINWADVTINLLRVHSRRLPPRRAAVAVPYRGYWFYIDDKDRNSKSTFMLLNDLFALQSGDAKEKGPVLTLPIG